MKYRILTMVGMLALSAGWFLHAQDYDDIYYDASKSANTTTKVVKTGKTSKTEVVYGEVPAKYKVAAQDNYRVERDVDEYNRRGDFEPEYEVDINGDTIYEEAFANTRRIERFYNPDIVILSDDDDLVELYYDESPTINLIVGSDYAYASYGWNSFYDPWYWYTPYYMRWGRPWHYGWYSPWYYDCWHYGDFGWYSWYRWGANPWYYSHWHYPYWRGHNWDFAGVNHYNPVHHRGDRYMDRTWRAGNGRTGLATNRNTRGRMDVGGNRNSIGARNAGTNRNSDVSRSGNGRTGYATSRSGNMGSRSSGASRRSGANTGYSSSRSGSSSSYGSSRSSSSSYGGGRSSSSSSGSWRSSGSSSSSGGSHSGGSRGGSGGGGSHGGSSGGGAHRR